MPSRSTRLPTGRLEDPIHNILEVIGMLRGIQTTLSSIMPGILRSDFALLFTASGLWRSLPSCTMLICLSRLPSLENSVLSLDTWDAIDELRAFMETAVPASSLEHHAKAVEKLFECAKLIAVAGVYFEAGGVVVFMYSIYETILMDIGARRPHALVILTYYAIFLATMEKNFWYSRG
ncbi:hypothetical protein EDB81DRAFT_759839 [Dactylonectria macrodidyma]|uniref:Uncharacterized protein n=1 Tax=Dactylonectria macrodidyma TaxID=307937 RepID=A0A9P9ERN3_9HYPO|nr:hypothetical protein EDB81DRAFT_759839 [Dactylonectria macrodidyma]